MKIISIIFASIVALIMPLNSFANASDTLEKIKNTGTVTIGVRESSGLAYSLGKGEYVGFHTDLARNIVNDISKDLNKPINIIYQPITSENRIPLLENGTIDFECGSTTNNVARAKKADFAYTTFVEETKIVVKKNSGIKNFDDLKGKTVATTAGSNTVIVIKRKQREKHINLNLITARDHADCFLLLESGRADAFVMDASILAALIAKSKNPQDYVILDDTLSVEPIACMLRLHDDQFKNLINQSIVRQIKDGTLNKLYDKWFLQPIPPNNVTINLPLSPLTIRAWENPNADPTEAYPENQRKR